MTVRSTVEKVIRVEPRDHPPLYTRVFVPLISVGAAAIVGAILLIATGHSPGAVYAEVFDAGFGGSREWIRTLILATPLILTALAAAVAFRTRIWNIGAEGQLYIGAVFASGIALLLTDLPAILLIPVVVVAGAIGGALWAGIAALLKAYLNTDEVISTLMLTFIASHFIDYLILGSSSFWHDSTRPGALAFRDIPEAAELPRIWGRLHLGFVIAVALAVFVWWLMKSTRWGFEVRVVGDSPLAARYSGIFTRRVLISVLLVSGGLAGVAGAVEVSGVIGGLQPVALQTGLGFTGIVVAAIAFLNPIACIPVAILLAGFLNSGPGLQELGVPIDTVFLLQGLILLLVAGGEFMLRNKVRIARWATQDSEPETA